MVLHWEDPSITTTVRNLVLIYDYAIWAVNGMVKIMTQQT